MNEINFNELIYYEDKTIYKYQFFQIYEVDPMDILVETTAISYYPTISLAKQRQAYELYKLMSGTYKPKDAKEYVTSQFFERYVDEKDVEFCVIKVTNGQMDEYNYFKYINQLEKDFPEKLI